MKKLFLSAALLLPIAGTTQAAGAQPIGPQHGYTPVSIAAAKDARDDALVQVQGRIVKRLSGEEYELQDATGTIVVEIDDELWQGLNVTDQDQVSINAEVDQDWNGTELDAQSLTIINR